ncbi:MAG: translation initiation factor IF-3, partial [Desulfobulbaceae bacterium]|nr:translation initiation factor IF-3 [Desulfobulbaceae bacterium]
MKKRGPRRFSDDQDLRIRVNDDIDYREIRLIGSEGDQLGIVSPREAMAIAHEQGLDLVEVSDKADPPVCRIMNYDKFRYEL